MPEHQDPRPDPQDVPPTAEPHVRGEDVYPGATAEPTMGWSVSPESRVHHADDPAGARGRHPAVWAVAVVLAVAVAVLLVVLLG